MKKSLAFLLSAVLIVTAAIGCGNAKAPQSLSKREGTVTVTDQIGREVTLEAPAEKIVSVYYLSTSLLVLLGASDQLVGIEKKADSRGLYRLASPELLDLEAVGSGKEIDVEKTAALAPDIVIIPKKLKDSVEALEQAGLKVLVGTLSSSITRFNTPSFSADSSMPLDICPIILRGGRLVQATTVLPTSCSG